MTTATKPDAKAAMIDVAERLFAERGIGAVSLREIGREAGQRNTGAVQYHFGDVDGVVDAILARHAIDIDASRSLLLDQIERDAHGDVPTEANRGVRNEGVIAAYAAALVEPLGAKLADPSGRSYLGVAAELVNRPRLAEVVRLAPSKDSSLARWRRLVLPHLPDGARELHSRFNAIQFAHTELARRSRRRNGPGARLLVVSRLTDLTASILATPLSDRSAHLLSEISRHEAEPLA